jgi:selenocysteine lyase/cysteine desulfurase
MYFFLLWSGMVAAVADVAEFLGADWRDVVPVVNATTAVNTVVNSIKLKRRDLLLMTNATYPAVRTWVLEL